MSGLMSHFHTWVTTADGRRCTSCGEERYERPHAHVFGPLMARVCLDCGAVADHDFNPIVIKPGERPFIDLPRRIEYGDRKPIVIRSSRPRTSDEMREMWEILAAFPWPVLPLDHDWEVHGG